METPAGFWPANVTLAHAPACLKTPCASDCPVSLIDARPHGSKTQPSRLFFCAKTTRAEREAGCEQLPRGRSTLYNGQPPSPSASLRIHPTVKPVALMRWLVRLTLPRRGLVLDPFTGSGSSWIAAVQEGSDVSRN